MTKKKIWFISLSAVAVVLIAVLVCGSLFSQKLVVSGSKVEREQSESDEDWKLVSEGSAVLESTHLTVAVDAKTGHLTVKDKTTGKTYSSIAPTPDEEKKNQSELVITYYDENNTVLTMNTAQNCVENGNLVVKTDGEKIRAIYTIQKDKVPVFVPEVLSAETFEEEILSELSSGEKRRLKKFYNRYEPDGTDSATKEKKSEYPALEKEALYIVAESSSRSNSAEITTYMNKAGFDENNYMKELERLGMEGSVSIVSSAGFQIPLEYSLDEKGFRATILNDRIESESDSYTLTNIDLLPYFSCIEGASEGYMLVPDGSGAMIELEEKSGVYYTQNVYGMDPSILQDRQAAVTQNVGMPVFGFNDGEKSFLAVIESSEAVATINAEVYGNEYAQSRIYAEFQCLAFDSSSAIERNMGDFNLYAKDYIGENPQIYYILGSEAATYSTMATDYREYLIATGVLTEKLSKGTPLYLDFTGYETTQASVMGIATNEKVLFSDIEGMEEALDQLKKAGITGTNVRLKAYGDGGLYSKVQNGLKLEDIDGEEAELKALAERLNNEGGRLYLENGISTIWEEGNGLRKNSHAAKDLKKMVVKGLDYDLVSRKEAEVEFKYMFISPIYLNYLAQEFIDSFGGKLGDASLYGYSRSDLGSKLWSDFNQKGQVDRCESAAYGTAAAELAAEQFSGVMTDGNNSYALEQADHLLNMPLNASAFQCESYDVPFYQMAVHGYKSYAGAPINISLDGERTYLQSAETGASLYFSCYTETGDVLKKSASGTHIYPTEFSSQVDTITAYYERHKEVFADLYDQVIIEHRRISDTLKVTTYEDGTQIAVNYGDSDVMQDGVTVPANDFAVVKEGTK